MNADNHSPNSDSPNPLSPEAEDRLRSSMQFEASALTHRFEGGLSGASANGPAPRDARSWRRLMIPIIAALALIGGGGAAAVTAFGGTDPQPVEIAVPATPTPTPGPVVEPTAVPDVEPTSLPETSPDATVIVTPPTPEPTAIPTSAPTAEPTETAEPPTIIDAPEDTIECTDEQRNPAWRSDVINVEPDDADGGLVVHTSAGVNAPVVGVLPWNTTNVQMTGRCAVLTDSGAIWWQVSVGGRSDGLEGWVNAAYIGDRVVAEDSLAVTPCSRMGTDGINQVRTDAFTGPLAISRVDVESTAECDRVVMHVAENWTFDTIARYMDLLPEGFTVGGVMSREGSLDITLTEGFTSAFEVGVQPVPWTDVATGEQNVVFFGDTANGLGEEQTFVHVGYGTGVPAIRFTNNPARIIIDIFQEPTPDGQVLGPITSPNTNFMAPIQTDLTGPGVELPIRIRGYSRGFEGNTTILLEEWPEDDPTWYAAGPNSVGVDVELTGETTTTSYGPGRWFMTTGNHFSFTIDDLPPGSYALSLSPSNGIGTTAAIGQTFRVPDPENPDATGAPVVEIRTSIDELGVCQSGCGNE